MSQIPFALRWSLKKNQLLPLKIKGFVTSDSVANIPGFEYYLKIFLNGDKEEHRQKARICLCLNMKNVKKVEADFTITIETANYSKTYNKIYGIFTYNEGYCICDTKEFIDPKMKYIVDGKCIIKIRGIFKFGVHDAIKEQKWNGGDSGDELWNKDDTKDFTIHAEDGNEIKVHKFILQNRSDVFAAMFNSNMKESKEMKVEIPDFSFYVVETAFKMIYSCNFDIALSIEELMALLQFFDKYNFTILKTKTEPLLIDEISAATVCKLTNCAIQTNSFKLKEKCMEFLSTAFASKSPLHDIDSLDKEIAFEILKNSFYQDV